MIHSVVVDTGPLVALMDRRERHHHWAVRQLETQPLPWITCEAVLTEALFLLRARADIQDRVLECVADGVLSVPFSLAAELETVRCLRKKFGNVPMSLADGCLVRLSELMPRCSVLTLDADFHIYRRNGDEPVALLHPEM